MISVLLLLCARGIFGIVNSPSERMVYDALDVSKNSLISEVNETSSVGSLAELVAMEVMTYGKNDDTYSKRINAFGFPLEVDSSSLRSPSIAKVSKLQSITKLNKTQFNATVQVLVDYPEQESSKMIGLDIPIYKDQDNIRLDGIVMVKSIQKIESVKPVPFSSKPLEDETLSKEIVLQTENFLKNYYEGTQSELAVYLADSSNKEIVAMEGRVKLVPKKTEVTVYALQGGQYLSLVSTKIQDENGVELTQKLQVIVEKKNDKYLIVSMNPRVQNINEIFNIQEER